MSDLCKVTQVVRDRADGTWVSGFLVSALI